MGWSAITHFLETASLQPSPWLHWELPHSHDAIKPWSLSNEQELGTDPHRVNVHLSPGIDMSLTEGMLSLFRGLTYSFYTWHLGAGCRDS